jgi:hypothetical protein
MLKRQGKKAKEKAAVSQTAEKKEGQ